MNRRAFLQLLGFLSIARFVTLPLPAAAEPYDASGGQWVFDGVNGLTFPAVSPVQRGCAPTAARVVRLRALTFLERVFGGVK